MPELPEVETIAKDLRSRILDVEISKVNIFLPRIVRNKAAFFVKSIAGSKFIEIYRIGKLIYIKLDQGNKYLLAHLKMTGQLVYRKGKRVIGGGHSQDSPIVDLPNKYTRVSFEFSDGSELFFNDMRTFGYLKIADEDELNRILKNFGVDPIAQKFDFKFFHDKVKARKTSVKAILLNQSIVAGIGNIYADEILYRAGIRPGRKAGGLKKREWEKIFNAIKPMLKQAIKYRGTTFNDYVDANGHTGAFISRLKVYGRGGEKCRKCGGEIKKTKVAQRGTHYCPKCQS